jgi:uncharacterized protein (UPF0335 family)
MTNDQRIDYLEERMTRFETGVAADIKQIFEKINALALSTLKTACPSPGACVGLSAELQHIIAAHNATMLRVERLEIELIKLNQQKAWIIGAWSSVAFVASIVGGVVTFVISKLWRP